MERNASQGIDQTTEQLKADSTQTTPVVKEVKSETSKVEEQVVGVETVVEKPSPVKTKVTKAKTPVSK